MELKALIEQFQKKNDMVKAYLTGAIKAEGDLENVLETSEFV